MLLLKILPIFYCLILESSSECTSQETCSNCIQEVGCVWCIKPRDNGGHCRDKRLSPNDDWCDTRSSTIVNPETKFAKLLDQDFSSNKGATVQIRPQMFTLKLRKGQSFSLNFTYKQARNYPVDLYYLMDLSYSMAPHKDKLGELGKQLASTMANLTNNFRLGFGSFIDKVVLPFTSTVPEKLKAPCEFESKTDPKTGKKLKCHPPYSFKNHMTLSDDFDRFEREVTEAKVSGNLDAPEGGLDAMMQAMVCKDTIGWREHSRHLLVLSTDGQYHMAGDGRLGGVVEPNDAKCRMDKNEYPRKHALTYDYPSVSQINYVAKENNVNVIFAIVGQSSDPNSGLTRTYRDLSQNIENSNMGILDQKSTNVIQLVLDNYKKIANTVIISNNASSTVDVKISSPGPNCVENKCSNVHVEMEVPFTVTITPLDCSASKFQKIAIKPEGVEESLMVDLEILCDCDCEQKNFEKKSPTCSNSGDLKCGVCFCDPGKFGNVCQCDKTPSISTDPMDESGCKPPNTTSHDVCSNHGKCICGKCECNKRSNPEEKYTGKYCDCNNFSCKKNDGQLCSGHGTCGCGGICKCDKDWVGETCECHNITSPCINPLGDDSICSDHGQCKCGKCDCFKTNTTSYSGNYCEERQVSTAQMCAEIQPCVECLLFQIGEYHMSNTCHKKCVNVTVEKVKEIDQTEEDKKFCIRDTTDFCKIVYQYATNKVTNHLVIKAEERKCPEPASVFAWVAGVIGSILLAGLIILIVWKVFTTIHDRREYAKFENERQKLKWHRNDNPLYKEATSTFANPAYSRSSKRFSFRQTKVADSE